MNSLYLFDGNAYASGGFMADMQVEKDTMMGGQQQWFTRNSQLNTRNPDVLGGAWNFVFVGTTGAPPSQYPQGWREDKGITNVAATPGIAEKPFITIDNEGKYNLQIPAFRHHAVGPTLNLRPSESGGRTVGFEHVFVADNKTHSAADVQAKLDAGLHVVLAPGIFQLAHTLTLKHPGQVLLGIGMSTLNCPTDGTPCVRVAPKIKGVRVAGLMLSASRITKTAGGGLQWSKGGDQKTTMFEWGELDVHDAGDMRDPGVMTDIFARVGGPDLDRTTSAEIIVRVHSGNVIGDNLWLWRADHAELGDDDPEWPERKHPKSGEGLEYHLTLLGEHHCETGLEVIGDDVTMYGLFVEHTVQDMTIWRGDGGKVYFYQSELPYDVTQESFCDKGYSGYFVGDDVKSHEGYGIGIYAYFRDYPCVVESGIRAPETDGVRFTNIFSRYLNGEPGIKHVLNQQGEEIRGTDWWAGPQKDWTVMYRLPSSIPWKEPDQCSPQETPAEPEGGAVRMVVSVLMVLLLCVVPAFFLGMVLEKQKKVVPPPAIDVEMSSRVGEARRSQTRRNTGD